MIVLWSQCIGASYRQHAGKKQCFWLKNEDTDKAWKKCCDLNSGTRKMQCYDREGNKGGGIARVYDNKPK